LFGHNFDFDDEFEVEAKESVGHTAIAMVESATTGASCNHPPNEQHHSNPALEEPNCHLSSSSSTSSYPMNDTTATTVIPTAFVAPITEPHQMENHQNQLSRTQLLDLFQFDTNSSNEKDHQQQQSTTVSVTTNSTETDNGNVDENIVVDDSVDTAVPTKTTNDNNDHDDNIQGKEDTIIEEYTNEQPIMDEFTLPSDDDSCDTDVE
jgi:hypothetical protein